MNVICRDTGQVIMQCITRAKRLINEIIMIDDEQQ